MSICWARHLLLPTNEVWGKVMFLHLSVSHSVHSGHRSDIYLCISTDRLWCLFHCAFLLTYVRGFPISSPCATPIFLPHNLIHPDYRGAQIPSLQVVTNGTIYFLLFDAEGVLIIIQYNSSNRQIDITDSLCTFHAAEGQKGDFARKIT